MIKHIDDILNEDSRADWILHYIDPTPKIHFLQYLNVQTPTMSKLVARPVLPNSNGSSYTRNKSTLNSETHKAPQMIKYRIFDGYNLMVLWIAFSYTCLQAQSPEKLVAQQQQKLAYLYVQDHGGMGLLIHGKVYEDYFPTAKGIPFWFSTDWKVGSLQTEHFYYPKLPLKYDAHLDALIYAANLVDQTFVRVNELQVKSFWIQERQFDYLIDVGENATKEISSLTPGYFELLYEGKSKLYAKRIKRFQKNKDDYFNEGEFFEESIHVLLRDQTFWIIKGKRDLVEFTKDHEDEMDQYFKQQGIRFRSISDDQLVQLIAYYDSL